MSDKEQSKETKVSEIQKTDDISVTTLLAELVRKQDSRIDAFEKRFDGLETLIKETNKNPVDSGVEAENKPKTEDSKDVGDPVTAGNEIAPKPSEAQASIIAPAVETSGSDKDGLKMENKADDEKEDKEDKEDKKEDVEKADEKEEKDMDYKKSKSDFEYEIVKTVRPAGLRGNTEIPKAPTAYQVLKATVNGWGKTSSVEDSLAIMYAKEANGEFGNGRPTLEGVFS